MSLAIERYALVSNRHTGALIGSDGSVDWLCLPRYDSPSTFGAVLGDDEHGHWRLAPADPRASAHRDMLPRTLVLASRWQTDTGEVEVLDFMPRGQPSMLIRRVRGIRGSVLMRSTVRIRFGYASALPWVRQVGEPGSPSFRAVAGPDALLLRGPRHHAEGHSHTAEFEVEEGRTVDLVLAWFPSHMPDPAPPDVDAALTATIASWREWADRCSYQGAHSDAVMRSLLLLRALTDELTGGIVAAATTSLPEVIGGERNWDYRYVWLRDAALTLSAFLQHSHADETRAWRDWLLRAIAGDPNDVQIMYGIAGERWLPERLVTTLPGHRGSAPVRVGNAAVSQYQADVIGEVMVALHEARVAGIADDDFSWPMQRALMAFAVDNRRRPDRGIWEVRGPNREFTHSRVMLWAALDRAVRGVREFGLPGPADHWAVLRDDLRDEIETHGYSTRRGSYVQYYGTERVDAALLRLPQVGYCAPDDPRMLGTVAAIEQDLMSDGLLLRYRTDPEVEGLEPGEHPFLACSFWLAEQYARTGRLDEGVALMDRLLALRNEVGMLSEEYDVAGGHQAGNTPQALSHLALIQAADAIARYTDGLHRTER